jgi:hypothetical protein
MWSDINCIDKENDLDLENARKRAGHTKEQITKTVYRLKGEASKPNRRKSTFK